jgi:hypothetical protein
MVSRNDVILRCRGTRFINMRNFALAIKVKIVYDHHADVFTKNELVFAFSGYLQHISAFV